MARARLNQVLQQTLKNLESYQGRGNDILRKALSGTETHTVDFSPRTVGIAVRSTIQGQGIEVSETDWVLITKAIVVFCKELRAAWSSKPGFVVDGWLCTREATITQTGRSKGQPTKIFKSMFEGNPYKPLRDNLNRKIANILNQDDKLKFVDAGHKPGYGVSESALFYALGDNLESTVKLVNSTSSSRQLRMFIEKIPEPFKNRGKAFSIQVEIEAGKDNRGTASKKNTLGYSEQEFLGVLIKELKGILQNEDWGSVQGSPSIRQEAVKAIADAARGKKEAKAGKVSTASLTKKIVDKNYTAIDKTPTSISKEKRQTANWASLIPIINAKLPQFVRQNMGYPSLVNRTGAFSQSARVTDVNLTPKGSPSFGITYNKQPYGVFDRNLGAMPWATPERDPHTIIEKSLRQILSDLAIGRFYVRRQ